MGKPRTPPGFRVVDIPSGSRDSRSQFWDELFEAIRALPEGKAVFVAEGLAPGKTPFSQRVHQVSRLKKLRVRTKTVEGGMLVWKRR